MGASGPGPERHEEPFDRGPYNRPEPPPLEGEFPWPPPEGRSAIEALVDTWRTSVFQPTRFFRAMPTPDSVGPAVVYYLIVGVLSVGLSLFWQVIFDTLFSAAGFTTESDPSPLGGWAPIASFLFSPVILLLVLGIGVLITHAILAIVGGARRGLSTTCRVLAFAYGPALFTIIPFVGALIGSVWSVVLAIIGLREAHRTDGWRAAVAILAPLVILIILAILFAIFIGVVAAALLAA